MEVFTGKSIYKAIAIGNIYVYKKAELMVVRRHIDDVEEEIKRFEQAKEKALDELSSLYEEAVLKVGKSTANIMEVHMMMMGDDDYLDSILNIIRTQEVNAEFAVATTSDNFSKMFSDMDNEYMKERAADVVDISERLIKVLTGENTKNKFEQPVILVAKDLSPSETVQLDKSKILAFVTEQGSVNSHTAILARNMGIPALVGTKIDEKYNGKLAIVDGNKSKIIIDPTKDCLQIYKKKKELEEEQKILLQEMKGKKSITKDGKEIKIYANISSVGDVVQVLSNDAGGIGLFRSEFLYLEENDYPSEDKQFQVYKQVAENMAGKKVIIRTLDIGADKKIDYFNLPKEENTAMGLRAIRICLTRPEIFKTQLRAIFRASVFGTIAVMFPMITSLWEIKKIKEIIREVKKELRCDGIPYDDIEIGIMIETPASVMISDILANEVDFFSIGTNDLTQYTLAIDRQNQNLDAFYNSHHEAILRMIDITIKNGHKANCWVGICGELASDMTLTKTFIEMGIDELSVSPSYILPIRKLISTI